MILQVQACFTDGGSAGSTACFPESNPCRMSGELLDLCCRGNWVTDPRAQYFFMASRLGVGDIVEFEGRA